jgi:hypothetical protein
MRLAGPQSQSGHNGLLYAHKITSTFKKTERIVNMIVRISVPNCHVQRNSSALKENDGVEVWTERRVCKEWKVL